MNTTWLQAKAKAVAGAVVAAVVGYVGTAIATSTVITAHGLELAAVGAVLTFLGVHQAPANKPVPKPRKRAAKAAGLTLIEVLLTIAVLAFVAWLIVFLVHHTH